MKLDLPKLGAGMLAASPLLVQLAGEKWCWWLGILMAAAAPFLMSVKS